VGSFLFFMNAEQMTSLADRTGSFDIFLDLYIQERQLPVLWGEFHEDLVMLFQPFLKVLKGLLFRGSLVRDIRDQVDRDIEFAFFMDLYDGLHVAPLLYYVFSGYLYLISANSSLILGCSAALETFEFIRRRRSHCHISP